MPVVINEFEVVPGEAPASAPSEQNGGDATTPKEKPDTDSVLRFWHERQERVRAH